MAYIVVQEFHRESDQCAGQRADDIQQAKLQQVFRLQEPAIKEFLKKVRRSPLEVLLKLYIMAGTNRQSEKIEDFDDDRWLLRLLFQNIGIDYETVIATKS